MKAKTRLSGRLVLVMVPILVLGLGASAVDRGSAEIAGEHAMGGGHASSGTGGGYAGAEACAGCHDEQYATIKNTVHGKTFRTNWDGAHGCETCHGPGQRHIDEGDPSAITNLAELKASELSDMCLTCHERGGRANWKGSTHDHRGVSCIDCHDVHQEGVPKKALLKVDAKDQWKACGQCHVNIRTAMMRNSHHPVREGVMSCGSCHNPHGTVGPAMLHQFSVNEQCYECHAEFRSPVAWEHPPVRENCANCHNPHGSVHAPLLHNKQSRLCQQCHDEARHPTQPYDSAQDDYFFPVRRSMYNKACLNCHVEVHGSNHPAGHRFMR